jgi:DNA-binding transcriptional ArsR family regulator
VQAVLKALAEPRRVAILKLVAGRELPAGEIASRFRTSRPAISQHLRVLTDAGLLAQRRVGTMRLYRARPETLLALRGFLDSFWSVSLDALKREAEADARRSRGRR